MLTADGTSASQRDEVVAAITATEARPKARGRCSRQPPVTPDEGVVSDLGDAFIAAALRRHFDRGPRHG